MKNIIARNLLMETKFLIKSCIGLNKNIHKVSIFKIYVINRNIVLITSLSLSISIFLHDVPRHSLQNVVHLRPDLRQVQRLLSHPLLHPHRMIFNKSGGPASSSVMIGNKISNELPAPIEWHEVRVS